MRTSTIRRLTLTFLTGMVAGILAVQAPEPLRDVGVIAAFVGLLMAMAWWVSTWAT